MKTHLRSNNDVSKTLCGKAIVNPMSLSNFTVYVDCKSCIKKNAEQKHT